MTVSKTVLLFFITAGILSRHILFSATFKEKTEAFYEVKDSTQPVFEQGGMTGVSIVSPSETYNKETYNKNAPSWTKEFEEPISIIPARVESEKLLTPIKPESVPVKSYPTGDNFIRLNMDKNGQRMEIQIDPLAVDAYIDIRYNSTDTSAQDESEKKLEALTAPASAKKNNKDITPAEEPGSNDPEAKKNPLDDRVKDMVDELDGTKKPTATDKVLNHMMKAQKLFYEGEYESALEEAKAAVRAEKTASGYSLLGSIFYMLEDTEGATAAWQKALSIDPNLMEVREVLDYMK